MGAEVISVESGHPDHPYFDKHTFIDGRGELVELTVVELRLLTAVANQRNGVLWDNIGARTGAEIKLYDAGLLQFKVALAKPAGARCVSYPTAIAAVQLLERGLM
ncbi:hypothetical protein LCGC14_0399960 [marine sediment metagenome]|uniref:Uncharacterized protein n=1 Tax=marine sediment metagenome TaxID=412755 RepID=A0A0F9T2S6_9ZZZZ